MPKGQWQEFRFVCREYRGLEVLCAWNAKGGNTLLGLRGKALSRLRAADHCPVIWRFAIWYWVLSVTVTEPLSSFAAIPSGKQLERKEKSEMKGTRHNGRSGKNGVYNPLHNDRRFNPEHSEHIDNERVRQNIYWDCYQGYTTMEDKGKEDNFSFEQIELAFYEEHYGNYVMKQNERHVKARHPDRCKEVEDVWKNKKTCPEESIYQLGTIDEHASVETLILVFDEFKKEFDERFGSNVHIIDWSLHMDEATPHIHERHVFDATNRYGEIEPKQETALEELGFELPDPEKKRSKTNNRKVAFDSACRTMFLDICKRHGLELDEEPSYGGRKYLEKQDYIRMKQKEEIADQQETILMQIDKVNENRLELAKQSRYVRANEEIIQSQEEKIKQQDTEFANNSDRIFKQGDLIEEQKNQLEKLTLEIDDIESLLQDVSDVAYEKAVEEVTNEVMIKTRQDDIQLIEGTKNWIDQPQRKASEKEKNYAKNRLDGVIKKIMKAMTAVQTVKDSLLQPKTKVKVVNEIKEKARPSIMSRLAEKKKELAEREANKKNDLKKSWNRDDR